MTEYAIIRSGNKQYKVSPGDVIDVDVLGLEKASAFECKEVLLYSKGGKTTFGADLAKAKVTGEVVADVRGPKVLAYKYKKRKNYRRKVGHRQNYTRVKIKEVVGVK
jgi:large subunit ribosomal protein L21